MVATVSAKPQATLKRRRPQTGAFKFSQTTVAGAQGGGGGPNVGGDDEIRRL
jgi:hypothetical protein